MSDPIDLSAERRKRRQQPELATTVMAGTVTLTGECEDLVHWFDTVPGPCKCGKEHWSSAGITTGGFGIHPVRP